MANERWTKWRWPDVFLFSMEVTFKTLLHWFLVAVLNMQYQKWGLLGSTSKSNLGFLCFQTLSCNLRWKATILIFLSFFHDRPQGKSYLFFTQFKAEIKGAKIEYATAYVSITLTSAILHDLTPHQLSETFSNP